MSQEKREPFHWRSGIAYKTEEKIVVRGYDLRRCTILELAIEKEDGTRCQAF